MGEPKDGEGRLGRCSELESPRTAGVSLQSREISEAEVGFGHYLESRRSAPPRCWGTLGQSRIHVDVSPYRKDADIEGVSALGLSSHSCGEMRWKGQSSLSTLSLSNIKM